MGSKKPRHEHEPPVPDDGNEREHEDVKAAKKRAHDARGRVFDQEPERLRQVLFGE